jgi:hypothetical protein
VKFHINPERGPMRCTATKRPCKYSGTEHFDSKDDAQAKFEESLKSDFGAVPNAVRKDSVDFSKSQVRDSDGNLLTVYHGSAVDFHDFNPEFTGGGNDSYGSGFYFNTDQGVANGYGSFTKKVQLGINNPIRVDGLESMSLNDVRIPADAARKILSSIPNIYEQPDSEEMNPLGDYVPEFWDKPSHTRKELDAMIDKMAKEYFSDASFVEMEHMFDGGETALFRKSLSQATGWDGVEVRFEREQLSHWVAWFPEQIKTVE